MKKTIVYCLELDGVTQILFSIEDLCETLKCEFEDISEDNVDDLEFTVYPKIMTEKEIEELPEFDGF